MRLLLANGEEVSVKSYQNTTAVVNGNKVSALSIVVSDITLDGVKDLFNKEDNLTDFNIYEDNKNIVILHAVGYQKRVSIQLGETDDDITVTLAKTTETDVLLQKIEAALTTISDAVSQHADSIAALKQSVSDVQTGIETATKDMDATKAEASQATQAAEDAAKVVVSLTDRVSASEQNVTTMGDSFNKASDSLTNIGTMLQQLQSVVDATNGYSADAVASVANLQNTFSEHQNTLDDLTKVYEETATLAKSHDEKLTDTSNSITSITKDVTKISNEVSTLQQSDLTKTSSIKSLSDRVTPLETKVSKVKETAAATSKTVSTLKDYTIPKVQSDLEANVEKTGIVEENVKAVAQDVSGLDSRITVLEPVTDYTTLSLEDAKTFRITESANVLEEYLASHPILSTCHQGVAAYYSITKEKQSYLQAMIMMASLAIQNGIEYQPSWNATGEVCSYDWTLEELQQLAMEIEAAVRPLVSYQQSVEKEIKSATSMEELQAVTINYNSVVIVKAPTENTEIAENTENDTSEESGEDGSEGTESTEEVGETTEDGNSEEVALAEGTEDNTENE
jgi:predicted  nucleic acid-binding Zn-ribbon protein